MRTAAKKSVQPVRFARIKLWKSLRAYKITLIDPEEKLRLIHTIETDDPDVMFAYWQKRFESSKTACGWYDLSAEEVKAFKRRKFM